MDYEYLKKRLGELGNYWYVSKGSLTCCAICERAQNDITAEIFYPPPNESNTFSVTFTEIKTNKQSEKEYSSIDDFIVDFKKVINLVSETERVYKIIGLF